MGKHLNIAILGHGSIAGFVLDNIRNDRDIRLSAVIARPVSINKATMFSGGLCPVITSAQQIPKDVKLVVDCAGHGGLMAHGTDILSAGIDLVTISTGALADTSFANKLTDAAIEGKSRLKLLSGAIGGIDVLTAASVGELAWVIYTGRKPPAGWIGSPAQEQCDLLQLSKPYTHFSGTAREAAIRYPKNANVAATIALAGIGMDETKVELIADPGISKNTHEVAAFGSFGNFHLKIEGYPLADNAKSSALAAMSIVQELRRRTLCVGF